MSYGEDHGRFKQLLDGERTLEEQVILTFYQSILYPGDLFPKERKMRIKDWVSALTTFSVTSRSALL